MLSCHYDCPIQWYSLIFPKHHTSGPVLVVYKPSGITTCMSPQMMMLMKIYLIPALCLLSVEILADSFPSCGSLGDRAMLERDRDPLARAVLTAWGNNSRSPLASCENVPIGGDHILAYVTNLKTKKRRILISVQRKARKGKPTVASQNTFLHLYLISVSILFFSKVSFYLSVPTEDENLWKLACKSMNLQWYSGTLFAMRENEYFRGEQFILLCRHYILIFFGSFTRLKRRMIRRYWNECEIAKTHFGSSGSFLAHDIELRLPLILVEKLAFICQCQQRMRTIGYFLVKVFGSNITRVFWEFCAQFLLLLFRRHVTFFHSIHSLILATSLTYITLSEIIQFFRIVEGVGRFD
ncbi:hypothetical protein Y032_0029g1970 [Ancylostoma ceylanicum]|uniref:Uncharacterized protein n=1 Tax=Ancylostoma ceylanicum TaxID=53326 RepID=A0A016USY4_9BILA|nr:hypothetical protein Y032_0029g1970 [Ancylostoma ceylanicum]